MKWFTIKKEATGEEWKYQGATTRAALSRFISYTLKIKNGEALIRDCQRRNRYMVWIHHYPEPGTVLAKIVIVDDVYFVLAA